MTYQGHGMTYHGHS